MIQDNLKESNIKPYTRRQVLKYSMSTAAATALARINPLLPEELRHPKQFGTGRTQKIIVIGAGAFGGWAALHLQRKGYKVTLIDQFGPGNNQASSGGETRVIRAFYGNQQLYFDMALRSIQLWKDNEPLMNNKVFHQNGLIVFVPVEKDEAVEASIPMYKKAGIDFERWSLVNAEKKWPQVNTSDLNHVMYDPVAGFLEARKGCMEVRDLFVKEGGNFLQQQVKSQVIKKGKCMAITLSDQTRIDGDIFLFAGGPWVVRNFPEISKKIKITRQVVFFFAPPSDAADLMENKLPCFFNKNKQGIVDAYGIPGCEYRGFKIAYELDDVINDKFDSYNRFYKEEELIHIQELLTNRFPKMKDRPLIEHRVCQYTETPDKDFILDTHPDASNLWIMGGGSGHGYKMGAAFGEQAAETINGERNILQSFALNRLLI